jgi:hypothetical protein
MQIKCSEIQFTFSEIHLTFTIMTQNGPGTAPGSQGFFGAKGGGSGMGARQLFGATYDLANERSSWKNDP